ncbi:MAG: diaminopimelate decarboxylase [Burkholderiaceae bacterium]
MIPELPTRDGFAWRDGELCCEQVSLASLAARFGTPTYVYSRAAIESAFGAYANALKDRPSLICYAMKANSNLAVLDLLARLGAGFDIVSGGELARVMAAGGDPAKVVFSGVGKSEREIEQALAAGILCFNIESVPELDRIAAVAARLQRRARISVRVNPDVDAKTHPYISTGLRDNKFGVAYDDTLALYRAAHAMPAIEVVGIDCHIGSQITEVQPYVDAADKILDLVEQLASEGIALRHIDFGGGLGIRYRDEEPPATGELVRALLARLDARGLSQLSIMFEPGRSIVGNAGVLLTRVEYLKPGETKNFAIVDAAMNDMARPAMYEAWMNVIPVVPRAAAASTYDVVGPVCESGDWLARERDLALEPGDLLAVMSAGAYGMSMASNYNSRGRAAEVLVDGATAYCVRQRETPAQLFAGESRLP